MALDGSALEVDERGTMVDGPAVVDGPAKIVVVDGPALSWMRECRCRLNFFEKPL